MQYRAEDGEAVPHSWQGEVDVGKGPPWRSSRRPGRAARVGQVRVAGRAHGAGTASRYAAALRRSRTRGDATRTSRTAAAVAEAAYAPALNPRCSATIPPVRLRHATFVQPASCTRRAMAGWSGQARIDSAR